MSTATTRQIAGNHYLKMGMQPIEFAMANGWDAGAFSILKYLSRHASKNGLQDIEKSGHFVELRDHFLAHVVVPDERVSMGDYIARNKLSGNTAAALTFLDRWVRLPASDEMRAVLMSSIKDLKDEYRAEQPSLLP